MRNAPEIVEVESTQLEEVLRRVEQALDEKDSALIRAVFQSYAYVADLVEDKNTSIRRLRQLFFGARTEKTAAVVGQSDASRLIEWWVLVDTSMTFSIEFDAFRK